MGWDDHDPWTFCVSAGFMKSPRTLTCSFFVRVLFDVKLMRAGL